MIFKAIKTLIFITTITSIVSLTFSTSIVANGQSLEVLDQLLGKIERKNKAIRDVEDRAIEAEGILKEALEARLDKAWLGLLEENLTFVESVIEQEKSGANVDMYRNQAIEILKSQNKIADTIAKRLFSQIKLPEADLSAVDLAAVQTEMLGLLDSLDLSYGLHIQSLVISRHFKVDVAEEENLLKKNITESAANRAIFLEMAAGTVKVGTLS